ncbi:unnamed protein product [Somion occarium]|uniref:Uncharacterized protein n=1 Tax=Somion occarium TaxID=3059160 RepID=A0ABP1CG66_9APHY
MDLSLRHLPDLSDATGASDFSEASFQIPVADSLSSDLLLADDSTDFFKGIDETLATPAVAPPIRRQRALRLNELTPKSKASRPVRSKSRPVIPSPLKRVVAQDLTIALDEALSPLKSNEPSFTIPHISAGVDGLLLSIDADLLKSNGADVTITDGLASSTAQDMLTLSQLSPVSRPLPRSPLHSPLVVPVSFPFYDQANIPSLAEASDPTGVSESVNSLTQEPAALQPPSPGPNFETRCMSPLCPEQGPSAFVGSLGNGESSAPQRAKQNPPPSGRGMVSNELKVKPKRTVIEGGISKRGTAKLPPSMASRKLSKADGKSNPPTQSLGVRKDTLSSVKEGQASGRSTATRANVKPTIRDSPEPGNLAAALLSYGLKSEITSNGKAQFRVPVTKTSSGQVHQYVPTHVKDESCLERTQQDCLHDVPEQTSEIEDKPEFRSPNSAEQHSETRGVSPVTMSIPSGSTAEPMSEVSNDQVDSWRQESVPSEIAHVSPEDGLGPTSRTVPTSPMCASLKRSASAEPALDESQRKKAKTDASSTALTPASYKPISKLNARTTRLGAKKKTLQASRVNNGARGPCRSTSDMKASSLCTSHDATKTSDKPQSSQTFISMRSRSQSLHATQAKLIDKPRQLTVSSSRSIHDPAGPNVASTSASGRSGDLQCVSYEGKERGQAESHGTLYSLGSSDSGLMQGPRHTPHESEKSQNHQAN